MSDGRSTHKGILRQSMKAIVEGLRADPVMIENNVDVTYTLEHPAKQITGNTHRFRLRIEPAGFSQTTGAGVLDLQYFTWITIAFKPATQGKDAEDELSAMMEYLTDILHKKMWGGMSTYISKCFINYRSCKIQSNHREVNLELAKDEIGGIMCLWQSPKNVQDVRDDEGLIIDID